MEKTQKILRNIKQELLQSHDIKNTLIRFYQISANPNMTLTPGQRGALNYYSALVNPSETDIVQVIDSILSPSSMSSSSYYPSSPSTQNYSSSITSPETSFEPIVQKINNHYRWNLFLTQDSDQAPLVIDHTLYTTPVLAQQKADEFIQQLKKGNEKEWLKFGLVSWANNIQKYPPQACQTEIIDVHNKFYLIVSFFTPYDDISEHQEIQTVKCSHKVLQVENMVEPTWLVRGYLPHKSKSSQKSGIFYLVYALKNNNNHTIENISNVLQKIICA